MKAKIVQFNDGSYGIRKFSFLKMNYIYKDLHSIFWWKRTSQYFSNCKGSLEEVVYWMRDVDDKGIVVKENGL